MIRCFWFLVLLVLTSSLLSQQIEYAYARKEYLRELTQPSRTLRENAPEIIASGNVNYIIGYAPVIVAPNISLSNFSANVEGMKIYFTNNFNSDQDILELSQSFTGVTETYDQTNGILVLEGSHDAEFWENVCRHVQYRNSSSTPIQNLRDVTFTLISAIFIPSTGHYYEFIYDYGISWSDSRASSDLASYYGLQGYLATITSEEENFFVTTELGGVGWIGGSDYEGHDTWKWVTGPESGTEYWEGRYPSHSTMPGSSINGMYSNWNNLEPNQHFGDSNPEMWEDYCHMIYNSSVGPIGSWNDLPDAGTTGNFTPYGYVVEYGGMPNDPEINLYSTVTVTVSDIYVNEILPSAGGELEIDETETINFLVDVFGMGGLLLSYSWKLDSIEVSTNYFFDFTTDYSSAGSYQLYLHIEEDAGSELSFTWDITVNDVDQSIVVNEVQPSAGGELEIDELESVAFSIDAYDPDGNILEYIWILDGEEISTTSTHNFTTDYTSAGTYIITLDVTDNFSRSSLNYTWDVTVNDVDQSIVVNEVLPSSGGELEIDELESVAFSIDAYDPDGNILEYIWMLDGEEVSTTSTYNFTTDYTSAGAYIITLDVTDNFSRSSLNYSWDVTVNDVDQSIVVNEVLPSAGGELEIDELESVAFSIDAYDPDGNSLQYSWKLDGSEVSATDSYEFTTDYSSAGSYIITLDVTDNFSRCSLNYIWDINVNDVDQAIVVNEILPSAGGELEIDELESVAFSIDAYDPDGNILEYIWMLDGEEVSTTSTYNFTTDYTSAGAYIITLDVTDNFSRSSLNYSWDVTVNDVDQSIVVNEVLPSAGGELEIDELESVAFSIDAYDPDGNSLQYSWKLDGSEVSATDSYEFTTDYSSAGSYIITLDVTDNFSRCSLNYIWDINVNDVDQAIVVNEILPSAGGELEIDELESVAFSIDAYDPDGNILEYIWMLDGEEVSTTSTYNFTTDYTSAGAYIITLDVTDNFSRSSLNYSWDVTVNDVDQSIVVNEVLPSAGGELEIDELESVAFSIDAYDPDGNSLQYSWKLDGSEVSATDSYEFTTDYSSAGSYIITLDVTDNFSRCSLNYIWDINVNDVDQAIVVNEILPSAGGELEINELESISFSIDAYDPDGNELEYIWQIDGANVSTTNTYDFTTDYSSAGSYIITLDVTDNFSRRSLNYTWDITVNDVDQAIVVNEILPTPGKFSITQDETVDFIITAENPDGDIYYSWILDGVEVSIVNEFLFDGGVNPPGNYSLLLIVSSDIISRETIQFNWGVSVIAPNLQPVSDAGEDQYVDSGVLIQLDGSDSYDPEGEDLIYQWIVPEQITISDPTIVNPIFTSPNVNNEVEYIIQLIVNDGVWNSEVNEVVITVNRKTISNNIEIQDDESAVLTIFNVKGQKVQTVNLSSGLRNFDWSTRNIGSGIYFYKIKSKTYSKTKKMILLK